MIAFKHSYLYDYFFSRPHYIPSKNHKSWPTRVKRDPRYFLQTTNNYDQVVIVVILYKKIVVKFLVVKGAWLLVTSRGNIKKLQLHILLHCAYRICAKTTLINICVPALLTQIWPTQLEACFLGSVVSYGSLAGTHERKLVKFLGETSISFTNVLKYSYWIVCWKRNINYFI